jgi:hypothetical protein
VPRPHRRRGCGLAQWGTDRRRDGPIVLRLDEDTARLLGVPLSKLETVTARLEPWGKHQDGQPVYRVRDLEAALQGGELQRLDQLVE